MKWSFLLFSSFLCLQAIAQYPATGNKMRLGWQTTGDGLVYRGAIGDTATLDPSGINNAWMLLDTANGNLYAYRAKAWRLVSGGGGGGGLTMPFDSVTFNVNETDASQRELKYSEEKGYLQYGGQDSIQIPILPGIWYVRNDTSVAIPKGTVLRATGTLGASGRIKVKHMIANGSIDAMYILGIAMQDIAVGADGYAMSQGKIRQVNTQAYSEGAVLYADVDTLGGLTQTEPTGSNLKLPIAFVVNSASNGTIAVRVTSGAYMRDLHDTYITSPDSSASLYYNKSEGIWRDTGAAVLVADTATMLSSYISNADTSVFARDFQISGTTNRLAMFTGANTVGNAPMSVGGDTLNIITNAGFSTFRYNRDFSISSNTFAGWPVGTRFYSLLNSTSSASVSFGDGTNGTVQNQAFMQLTSWTGGGANYYSSRLINNNTGDLGFYLSSLGSNANPTMSATPHLMILNGGNVGIGISSPSRPLHVAGTTAIRIPVGTTSDRGTSANGDIRYNTTNANFEWYSGTGWREPVNAARSPAVGLANRFSKFDANGLLDTSAILIQANNRIGIFNSPAAGDSALTVTGGIRATRDMYARRYNVSTFTGQVLSINNYAPAGSPGNNLWIGNGGQLSTWASGDQGSNNVSLGSNSLVNNTRGNNNLGLGSLTLEKNTIGESNAGIGIGALNQNISGSDNLALGYVSLYFNTTGSFNTAIGRGSLVFNTIGNFNTGIGYNSLYNTTGSFNIGLGPQAMYVNTGGSYNIAIGTNALYGNTTGNGNIALGNDAGYRIGSGSNNQTAFNSIFIGADTRANTSGSGNEIVIGYQSIGNGSNTTTIGNSSTTATILPAGSLSVSTTSTTNKMNINGNAVIGSSYIGTAAPADGLLVVGNVGIGASSVDYKLHCAGVGYFGTGLRVDYTAAFDANTIFQMPNTSTKAAKGYAWNTYSDARIKSNFDTIQNALQAVQALKPVYYDQHDSEVIDGKIKLQDGKTRTVGFIAQDVAPVIPAAVQAGNDTQLWGMDYAKLIPYLTKAIQEQQAQIEALKQEIEALKNK